MLLKIFIPSSVTLTPEIIENLARADIAKSISDGFVGVAAFIAVGILGYAFFKYGSNFK